MCALFGWLDYKGIVSDRLLKKLTQALANAAEERGTDASGIAYVKDGKVTIYKRPKPAHKLRFNAPNGTRAVMGHTRMTTQGNENFNYNNHPFYGHADVNFAFAHNGVLYNDKELRTEKHLPQTQIETDSYIAVQLLEQQGKLDFDSLKSMAELVQGSFCFTALDENNTIYLVKGSNPMCLLHFAQLGLYIYAGEDLPEAENPSDKVDDSARQEFEKVRPLLHCEDCGKKIVGAKRKDGTVLTASSIADGTKQKFGRVLCLDCARSIEAVKP